MPVYKPATEGPLAMEFQQISYDVADRVLTITLDRPDRLNAFTDTMRGELIEAFDRADADDDVRAIVVTGAGRGFCAGADLSGGGDTFDWRQREAEGEVPRDGGGTVALRILGIGQAMEWVATGRVFSAEEAQRGGLVRSVHNPDELLPAAYELAHEI